MIYVIYGESYRVYMKKYSESERQIKRDTILGLKFIFEMKILGAIGK